MKVNFGNTLKEIRLRLSGRELKILAVLVLPIYWVIILIGTFLHLN